ncbi:hypothetical protein A71_149 [Escherichia phage A7_1]|uniref:Uncharacterized protein n=1 Tax=Escherichia phage A73 TaxID=3003819 RepID=A0AAE9VXA5_9CAUD|nr:hypothetical protein A71_149 [Escherichia phage A7_1]WBF77584.1 hypothetical protein A73_106 [Escherichia phage A73]WBF77848.1 hypothetical protein W70_92 [Escherichia phage W70]
MSENTLVGIEKAFIESFDGWDEVYCGALYFYDVVLKEEYKALVPEGTVSVGLVVSSTESYVQFDFFDKDDKVITKTFEISLTLGKEKL